MRAPERPSSGRFSDDNLQVEALAARSAPASCRSAKTFGEHTCQRIAMQGCLQIEASDRATRCADACSCGSPSSRTCRGGSKRPSSTAESLKHRSGLIRGARRHPLPHDRSAPFRHAAGERHDEVEECDDADDHDRDAHWIAHDDSSERAARLIRPRPHRAVATGVRTGGILLNEITRSMHQ